MCPRIRQRPDTCYVLRILCWRVQACERRCRPLSLRRYERIYRMDDVFPSMRIAPYSAVQGLDINLEVCSMARYYYRRSPLRWLVGFLLALFGIAFVARFVDEWVVPVLPLAGAALLFIALAYVGFRRR